MLKALWTAVDHEAAGEYFSKRFELTRAGENLAGVSRAARLSGDALVEALQDKDVLIEGMDEVTRDVLKRCPNLKLIMSERDGPEENIDIEACTEMGIPVLFAAGRCAEGVAELNVGYMIALSRQMAFYDHQLRTDGWVMGNGDPDQYELYGKTVSIIGFGRNGKALANLLIGFQMRILIFDPYVSDEVAAEYGVEKVSLKEAMSQADYVCLLARLTKETEKMIGAEQIGWMKPTAFFINCARCALTDQDAIIAAVREGRIKGAGLDVHKVEWKPGYVPDYADISSANLIITRHIAGQSDRRVAHMYEFMKEGYEAFVKGEKTMRLNNPKVFESPEFKDRGGIIFGSESAL